MGEDLSNFSHIYQINLRKKNNMVAPVSDIWLQ